MVGADLRTCCSQKNTSLIGVQSKNHQNLSTKFNTYSEGTDAMMNIYLVQDSEKHWVRAEGREDALLVLSKLWEVPLTEMEASVICLPGDHVLTINVSQPLQKKSMAIKKTCTEWAADGGEGLIASTVS